MKFGEWIKEHWRPMMAIQYFVVCLCDFAIYPILWPFFEYKFGASSLVQWIPSTLGAGGTYHLAMGAVLGVAAWTRGQEKISIVRAPQPVIDSPMDNSSKNFRNGS